MSSAAGRCFFENGSCLNMRQVYGNLKVEVHSHSESGSEDAIAFSYIPKYLFYIVQDDLATALMSWWSSTYRLTDPFKNFSRRCVKSSRMDILLTFSPTPNKGRRDHGFIEFSMASKKATTRSWSKTVRAPPWRRGCLLMLCGCCIIQDVHIYIY